MTAVRFLSSAEISDIAAPSDYVDAVRNGYRQRGEGAPARPRTRLHRDRPPGLLTGYTAILPATNAMGGYMYAAGFGAGDAWFLTPLFDATTGRLQAILDGASMNPFKTGATGAVAVDELARADAKSAAIIGTGPQARGQLRTTATVRDLETVRVYSPTSDHRSSFADEFGDRLDADVTAVSSAGTAVEGADIIVTATTATEPVFSADNLSPGAHITAMGQYDPNKREVDTETVRRATYVPDLRERVTEDAGAFLAALDDGVITQDHVHAELGEIVAEKATGRTRQNEITLFDSGGTGIETVAAAAMLFERAKSDDLGTMIDVAAASDALTGR